jgi:hypothetical protein
MVLDYRLIADMGKIKKEEYRSVCAGTLDILDTLHELYLYTISKYPFNSYYKSLILLYSLICSFTYIYISRKKSIKSTSTHGAVLFNLFLILLIMDTK